MSFKDDDGGFAFACEDAKFSIDASTWNTKLSQIKKISGEICIMTRLLPNPDYIEKILSKRPHDIFIIAHVDADNNAKKIKEKFPEVRIALHTKINSKVAFIAPETVWVSSADFGETKMIESAIGLHSATVHKRGKDFFWREWKKAIEL